MLFSLRNHWENGSRGQVKMDHSSQRLWVFISLLRCCSLQKLGLFEIMARLDVDDELKGVDGWCVVRGWLFQHRIVFGSFCLTPVGPWCFFISIWCYSMYSFPNWFSFRVLYNLCFDLVASAHVHPPHTDMQRHNMNSRGVKLSPRGIRGKINWSLRLVVY